MRQRISKGQAAGVSLATAATAFTLAGTAMGQFSENFDASGSLPAGWTASGSGPSAPWSVVTDQSHTAPNSVFTNDVVGVASQFLQMPAVIATGPVTLDLWRRFTTESTFDGWVVEASINGGAFTNIGDSAWLSNGYNATISSGFSSPIAGQRAFSGAAATWTRSIASIPAASGDSVVLRFHMACDTTVSSTGVWIDDVVVSLSPPSGACCLPAGGCSDGTSAACTAAGGVFTISSTCAAVTCPAVGACCKNDGTCAEILQTSCTAQNGTWTSGSTCGAVTCNGACCNPDGTCTGASSVNACTASGGVFNGLGTTCGGVTCTPFFAAEVEPNETKGQATAVNFTAPGQVIQGVSTGAVSTPGATSQDTFLVKTPAAALGIYRNRLAITTSGPAGHVGTIRGLNQVAATFGPWPGPSGTAGTTDSTMQTSTASSTPARMNQWYGFGKQEQIYYRVTGGATTTAAYLSTLSVDPVTPTAIGPFPSGVLTFDFALQGHTTDTEIWIYDSNLNAIDGFGNDDRSTNSGGPLSTSLQGYFKRTFPDGTYYAAVSSHEMANNKGSPCDDNFRTGLMMDFPNSIMNGSTTTGVNVSFLVTDSAAATTPVAATRPGVYDVLWFKFTVGNPGPSCYANCDSSTQNPFLNVQDFTCFLTKFSGGDAYANCDSSTQAPVLNVQDFTCFLQKFTAGCSAP